MNEVQKIILTCLLGPEDPTAFARSQKYVLTDPEQQRICFHWTNLQPLFALENLQKSDKYVL